ncbi:MAG: hypothetical protein PHE83_06835 [Opitutaceae bacterium]|nr:hypothetical protein [Opitutaceae bacterium]
MERALLNLRAAKSEDPARSDLLTVIDGREAIVAKVGAAGPAMRSYIRESISRLLASGAFRDALSAALPSDAASQARLPLLRGKLQGIWFAGDLGFDQPGAAAKIFGQSDFLPPVALAGLGGHGLGRLGPVRWPGRRMRRISCLSWPMTWAGPYGTT